MFPNVEVEEKEADNDKVSFFTDLVFLNVEEEEEKEADDDDVSFFTDLMFS